MKFRFSIKLSSNLSRIVRGVALILALSTSAAIGQTVNTVYKFNTTNGAYPQGALVQGRDGKLYGVTYQSGQGGGVPGEVFRVDPSTGNGTILHSFGAIGDGYLPLGGPMLATDGNFYGAATYGGTYGGVLYKMTSGGAYTILHQFAGGSDGGYPYGPPIEASDGNLYGTTSGADQLSPATIYKFTRSGSYSVIYTFAADNTGPNVYGLTQGTDGLLYVATSFGGAHGCGTLVKITTSGVLKATHDFNCTSGGSEPLGIPMQASDGNIYGTTFKGGAYGFGLLYQLVPGLGQVNIVHNFAGNYVDGTSPLVGVVQGADGNLYGTAQGTFYSWSLAGAYSLVFTYIGSSGDLVQDTNGLFYDMSPIGPNKNDVGYVYSINTGAGPFITFVRANGKAGSTAQILGQDLTGTSSVTFNGIAASFAVVSDTYVTAVVPSGAATGPVVLATPSGTLASNKNFVVSK